MPESFASNFKLNYLVERWKTEGYVEDKEAILLYVYDVWNNTHQSK